MFSNVSSDCYGYGHPSLDKEGRGMESFSLNRVMASSLRYHFAQKRSEYDNLLMDNITPLSGGSNTTATAAPFKQARVASLTTLVPKPSAVTSLDISSKGLHEYDVVCGRSRMAHSHHGNKQFRRLIKEYSPTYQSTKAREEKKRITNTIIDTIHRLGGRFLSFDNDDDDDDVGNDKNDNGNDEVEVKASTRRVLCVQATPEYQYEKVSHALRSSSKSPQKSRRRSSMSSSSSSVECSTDSVVVSMPEVQPLEQSPYSGYGNFYDSVYSQSNPAIVSPIREREMLDLNLGNSYCKDDMFDSVSLEPIMDDKEVNFTHDELKVLFGL